MRQTMYKIGILSDTHGLLRPEVMQALDGCEAILHAGDINRQEILDRLSAIAPVYVVRGNNDRDWAEHIPRSLDYVYRGVSIFMTHKKKDLPQDLSGYDLVVYGHSHRYEQKKVGNTLLLNPGSCGPRRFHQEITMAIAEIDAGTKHDAGANHGAGTNHGTGANHDAGANHDDRTEHDARINHISIRRIDIPHEKKPGLTRETIQQPEIQKIIQQIRKGKSVSEISSELGIDRELAEQVCRLYLTHPGVTAEGIMTKMGL